MRRPQRHQHAEETTHEDRRDEQWEGDEQDGDVPDRAAQEDGHAHADGDREDPGHQTDHGPPGEHHAPAVPLLAPDRAERGEGPGLPTLGDGGHGNRERHELRQHGQEEQGDGPPGERGRVQPRRAERLDAHGVHLGR